MANSSVKTTLRFIYGFIIGLAILFGTNPPARNNVLIYLIFLIVSLLIYRTTTFQRVIIGIDGKNAFLTILFGLGAGLAYFFLTKFLPGLSLGVPLLPNAIGDSLKLIIVVIIAPFVEEIFFRGSLLAYLRDFNPSEKKLWRAILIQAVLFALAHLGAYISNFYDYSSIGTGFGALGANISVFIAAFLFAVIAGYIDTRRKVRNLWFSITFHLIINALVFTSLSVIF